MCIVLMTYGEFRRNWTVRKANLTKDFSKWREISLILIQISGNVAPVSLLFSVLKLCTQKQCILWADHLAHSKEPFFL